MNTATENALSRAVLCIFAYLLAVAPASSQEISYTAIEPTLNAQCVDYPPLGDGFGWNGRCGCSIESEWSEFGRNVAVSDNTIAISATDTPENCPGSDATISIYEKSESGSWVKQTEFTLEDENALIGDLNFIDGKLQVGRSDIKVYEKLLGEVT